MGYWRCYTAWKGDTLTTRFWCWKGELPELVGELFLCSVQNMGLSYSGDEILLPLKAQRKL